MQKRGFGFFFLATLGFGLYLLGYWQGQRQTVPQAAPDGGAVARQRPAEAPDGVPAAIMLVDAEQQGFDELLAAGAWFQLESWLVSNADVLTYDHGARLLQTLARNVNKYDAVAMRRVLRAYLARVPDDPGALFLLSDLQQIGGLREAALETLFSVLDHAFEPGITENARNAADQIIKVIDAELKNRGALAEREAFWRHISQRVSSSDYYRYAWAKALADLQRFAEARRVLAETGSSDIAQRDIDELLARIEIAEDGLVFERDGDRLLSFVLAPGGLTLTLLVDTGANVTSLSKSTLRALAAVPLQEEVRLRTASGVVKARAYRVAELQVQGRKFTDLRVIELPVELPGLDGLLGLDIINQLTVNPLTVTPT